MPLHHSYSNSHDSNSNNRWQSSTSSFSSSVKRRQDWRFFADAHDAENSSHQRSSSDHYHHHGYLHHHRSHHHHQPFNRLQSSSYRYSKPYDRYERFSTKHGLSRDAQSPPKSRSPVNAARRSDTAAAAGIRKSYVHHRRSGSDDKFESKNNNSNIRSAVGTTRVAPVDDRLRNHSGSGDHGVPGDRKSCNGLSNGASPPMSSSGEQRCSSIPSNDDREDEMDAYGAGRSNRISRIKSKSEDKMNSCRDEKGIDLVDMTEDSEHEDNEDNDDNDGDDGDDEENETDDLNGSDRKTGVDELNNSKHQSMKHEDHHHRHHNDHHRSRHQRHDQTGISVFDSSNNSLSPDCETSFQSPSGPASDSGYSLESDLNNNNNNNNNKSFSRCNSHLSDTCYDQGYIDRRTAATLASFPDLDVTLKTIPYSSSKSLRSSNNPAARVMHRSMSFRSHHHYHHHPSTSWNDDPYDDFTSPDEDERINRTLYLGRLDPSMDESSVREYFEPFGVVKSVIVKPLLTRHRRTTYGFVKMGNLIQAYRARDALDGKIFGDHRINIGYGKTYPTSRVWLGNIPTGTDTHLLYRELDRFGAIVKMVHFRASGEALIDFETISGALEAKNGMRGVVLQSPQHPNQDPLSMISLLNDNNSSNSSIPSSPSNAAITSAVAATETLQPKNSMAMMSTCINPSSTSSPTTISFSKNSNNNNNINYSINNNRKRPSSAAFIPELKGIVTDFDDHDSNFLMESASSCIRNKASTDASFSGVHDDDDDVDGGEEDEADVTAVAAADEDDDNMSVTSDSIGDHDDDDDDSLRNGGHDGDDDATKDGEDEVMHNLHINDSSNSNSNNNMYNNCKSSNDAIKLVPDNRKSNNGTNNQSKTTGTTITTTTAAAATAVPIKQLYGLRRKDFLSSSYFDPPIHTSTSVSSQKPLPIENDWSMDTLSLACGGDKRHIRTNRTTDTDATNSDISLSLGHEASKPDVIEVATVPATTNTTAQTAHTIITLFDDAEPEDLDQKSKMTKNTAQRMDPRLLYGAYRQKSICESNQ